MKDKLLERLELMNKAIEEQHKKLQQANADLNMLNGCRQELVHIINMADEESKNASEAPKEDVKPDVAESNAVCDNAACDDPSHLAEAAA